MAQLLRCLTALLCFTGVYAQAQPAARFDLIGPKIEIRVTRAGMTLPIAAVPNLQPGDKIWLHPAFPPTQSIHYLLIAAFLRGTTNPPPENWFTRVETWNKKVREEGVFITVPAEAQQAVLFLAPETGGDFATLRSAVRGRPGIFVRATEDLTEAGFEQARVEKYLASMKMVPPSDEAALLEHSNLLARTLNLRPNSECFKGPLDQQFNCLTQTGSQTLLEDGHGQTIVAAIANGPGSDFINAASNISIAGGVTYSAYVGAIVDFVRILNSVHTAQYQYIPAIAFPERESLNLRLNTAPSFHNPKSVIVIGLPPIQKAILPPLRPADPRHISCLLDPQMVLPVEGAPLVFSTSFAHDLSLALKSPAGAGQGAGQGAVREIPLLADAFHGGLAVAASAPVRKELPPPSAAATPATGSPTPPLATTHAPFVDPQASSALPVEGTIEGFWGFDRFTGPTVLLQELPGTGWHIVTNPPGAPDQSTANLIAGQPNRLQIASTGSACLRSILLEPGATNVDWKLAPALPSEKEEPRAVDLTLNLQQATTPGSIHLAIQQYGQKTPDLLGTKTFAQPASVESLRLYSGDETAMLTGRSLDQVKSLTLHDRTYAPVPATAADAPHDAALQDSTAAGKTLVLALPPENKLAAIKPNERVNAEVHLQDGRTFGVQTVVAPPRPEVSILSKRIVTAKPSNIHLAGPEEMPLGAQLMYFLKSKAAFPRSEKIEIANLDGTLHMTVSIADGSLVLEDAHTVLVNFDPLKAFGPSTFGPFHLRAVTADGSDGAWMPMGTIVRLPTLTDLRCPASIASGCLLSGSELYLLSAVAVDAAFTVPVPVPEGFVEPTLAIPRPTGGIVYLRLRDDPAMVQQATLPVLPETPAAK